MQDRIGFSRPRRELLFRLNRGLAVETGSGRLQRLDADAQQVLYRLRAERPVRDVVLRYHGRPVFSGRRGLGGMPQGDLSPGGVYLDDASAWYPLTDQTISGARVDVRAPDGWQVLSQGRRSESEGRQRWQSEQPAQALYLVGGPYHRHARRHGDITLAVWLLHDDPALAKRYLDLMGGYIDHYSALIGPYPYARFTVLENRWPTGLGMPSFTLLGGQVMRLPFIPYTSLPHEILHNWWGNGVWVDYRKGNWSEGLTAYLADHWMKTRRGKGAEYRLRALQRYSNYAARGRDMPLLDFVSRHDEASQSVGYSKSLMFFHMLRRALGDAGFEAGLRRLWQRHRYQAIGFEQALRVITGDDPALMRRFLPWLRRKGAPRLALSEVRLQTAGKGVRLSFRLSRRGPEDAVLDVPVEITLADGSRRREQVRLDARARQVRLRLPGPPAVLRIDPDYDVLRYLDPREQPPALSLLLGGHTWLVLPAQAPAEQRAAWQALAEAWRQRYPDLKVTDDGHTAAIPPGDNRLILGWDNRALETGPLSDEGFVLSADRLRVAGEGKQEARAFPRGRFAVVRVNTRPDGVAFGFIGATTPQTIRALARKLPHYGAYGVLAFDEQGAQNRFKATPANPHSPLVYRWSR